MSAPVVVFNGKFFSYLWTHGWWSDGLKCSSGSLIKVTFASLLGVFIFSDSGKSGAKVSHNFMLPYRTHVLIIGNFCKLLQPY